MTDTSEPTVDRSAGAVAQGERTKITVRSGGADHLRITGETDGWTITAMEPIGAIIGNPSAGDELPYESGSEPWYYAEDAHDELTIELEATVDPGTYEFVATELDTADEPIGQTSFSLVVERD